MRSSRNDSEKKGKVTSIRLTEEQHKAVQEKAASKGMTVSRYITEAAFHSENKLTPELMVNIQNIANMACQIANEYAPEDLSMIQNEVNKLWQKLS